MAAGHVDVEFVPGPGLFVALAVFLAADVAGGGQVGEHLAEVLRDLPLERRVGLKLIHMPDFDDVIYDFRTMANASTPG